jgi:hypothetical protein
VWNVADWRWQEADLHQTTKLILEMNEKVANIYREKPETREWDVAVHVTGTHLALLLLVLTRSLLSQDSDSEQWLGTGLSRKQEDSRCLLR